RALAYQHQRLGVLQALGQRIGVLDVVVPDLHVVAGELAVAGQCPQCVVVVVEYRDFHRLVLYIPGRKESTEDRMSHAAEKREYDFSDRTRYDALMEVVRTRMTVRAFDPSYTVPREHHEMILDAARHSPSGANAQPWHFIVVTDQALKNSIMEDFREEQIVRARLKMKF